MEHEDDFSIEDKRKTVQDRLRLIQLVNLGKLFLVGVVIIIGYFRPVKEANFPLHIIPSDMLDSIRKTYFWVPILSASLFATLLWAKSRVLLKVHLVLYFLLGIPFYYSYFSSVFLSLFTLLWALFLLLTSFSLWVGTLFLFMSALKAGKKA